MVVNNIDYFLNYKHFLYSWNKAYLVMLYSVYDFHIYVFAIFLSCNILVGLFWANKY